MSSYNQETAQLLAIAQGVSKTKTRAPRNTETLYGVVLSCVRKEAVGKAKPKYRMNVQLGALVSDPLAKPHPETGKRARRFEVDSKSATLAKMPVTGPRPLNETWVQAYDVLDLSVEEEAYVKGVGIEGSKKDGVETGDIVEVLGISFSNYYSDKVDVLMLFCNVDRISFVPGATRAGYARDIWLALSRPIERFRLEQAQQYQQQGEGGAPAEENDRVARLGKTIYVLNSFGTDTAGAEQYWTRAERETTVFRWVPEKDPTRPKSSIVTYTPDVYNRETGTFFEENGFDSQGIVKQRFADGSEQLSQVFAKVRRDHLAPLGCLQGASWPSIGPVVLPQLAFTLLVKENLEKTANETSSSAPVADGEEGDAEDNSASSTVAFRMIASVQGALINVATQLERVGLQVPASRVVDMVGAKTTAPDAGPGAYRHRDLVISLNEYATDVEELVRRDKHDFYLLTNTDFDEENRSILEDAPADKRYLIFDRTFRDTFNKAKGAEAKAAVAQSYGLDRDTSLPQLNVLASGKILYFYAVKKPELRVHECIDSLMFKDAVHSLVPDAPAFLAQLRGGADGGNNKRKPEDAPTEEPDAKSARNEADAVNA